MRMVWCKYGTFDWWPALISGYDGTLLVAEFDDGSYGSVSADFVQDFEAGAYVAVVQHIDGNIKSSVQPHCCGCRFQRA